MSTSPTKDPDPGRPNANSFEHTSHGRVDDALPPGKPVTLKTLHAMARAGTPFACLTAYDATMARWLERAGVPLLLVGDSAAEVVLGHLRTIHMPLEISLALTAAVKRGAPNTVVMGDMPFMSYEADPAEGARNAGRFLTEGGADIVKVEVDRRHTGTVAMMTAAGIPVCAHIGSNPQRAAMTGGYASAGRSAAEAVGIVEDALALEAAGAVMLLIEAVPAEVTQAVLDRTSVPVIGIGAGPACHGQILVVNDLLGMTDHPPRFADAVASVGATITQAGRDWIDRVTRRAIGGRPYAMKDGEVDRFVRELAQTSRHALHGHSEPDAGRVHDR